MQRMILVGLIAVVTTTRSAPAQSNVDPEHKFAWCENVGWTNWRDAEEGNQGVLFGPTFLSGFVWGENVGWINVGDGNPADDIHYANTDGEDFGVNVDPETGELFGFAWGENIGWIKFDTSVLEEQRARFDRCDRRLMGFAWAENIGWLNLNDATHYVAFTHCAFGDFDCDGDVALDDHAVFAAALDGPDVTDGCIAFDADADDDVDLADFAAFQVAFTGDL